MLAPRPKAEAWIELETARGCSRAGLRYAVGTRFSTKPFHNVVCGLAPFRSAGWRRNTSTMLLLSKAELFSLVRGTRFKTATHAVAKTNISFETAQPIVRRSGAALPYRLVAVRLIDDSLLRSGRTPES
jgi:hypothetical protein